MPEAISGRGACTRLHGDPWTTAAVLCQFHGEKELVMYEPSQAAHLIKGREFADIRRPDPRAFPCMRPARPSYEDLLRPGEVLFIPSQWLHHVNSLTESISVTCNFVHPIDAGPQSPQVRNEARVRAADWRGVKSRGRPAPALQS